MSTETTDTSTESSLQELGLTKNESKVYLALLDIGLTTTSRIIKTVGINTSKVYESLERLLKKGLVSYTIIKNKKHWQAENPTMITDYIKEEKKALDKKEQYANTLIKELLTRKNIKQDLTTYKIYEGIKGIKTAREQVLSVLKKDDCFYIILSNYPKDDKLEAYWMEFQQRRAKSGIICKYILNETLRKTGEKREKNANTETRYVDAQILSPTWMEIYADYVVIGVLGNDPSVFMIKNKSVATGFLNYFNFLWKMGKR